MEFPKSPYLKTKPETPWTKNGFKGLVYVFNLNIVDDETAAVTLIALFRMEETEQNRLTAG